jgi:hypothetical protein
LLHVCKRHHNWHHTQCCCCSRVAIQLPASGQLAMKEEQLAMNTQSSCPPQAAQPHPQTVSPPAGVTTVCRHKHPLCGPMRFQHRDTIHETMTNQPNNGLIRPVTSTVSQGPLFGLSPTAKLGRYMANLIQFKPITNNVCTCTAAAFTLLLSSSTCNCTSQLCRWQWSPSAHALAGVAL